MTQTLTLSTETVAILNQRGTPVLAVFAVKFAVCVTKMTSRRRTRNALKQLEPWQLDDVGLTPKQAHDESIRVFWKA
ncbi:DUF1127 domain-containing protein [Sulfitobacter sp. CW3]|jgi:uncharacterized protein YjiS (DUF1127 family)|uniref:DUF1127 domain-containing protein n=1 Tax=unclassified Sulfitobacter TaxID=196795 RepID=UPI0019EE8DF3|nr:DUF1127 domain-containing protein [Sulfitobacter sp. CW3]MBW4961009.1 DUF1127 domain-containing protein [Sulfitobacter sp. CW3]NOR30102.1 DUF1127 domain-containing protein [Sulfitobacter sp.]|tara:strand:+ start:95401 stop:95631 length:231 start_codon:yes stop_codon:yes gene_type:complete